MDVDLGVLLATVTAYGAVVTKLVDAVRNTLGEADWVKKIPPVPKENPEKGPSWLWQVVGFLIGIGMAYLLNVNLFGGESWGKLVTGLAIGASGSGYHEVFDALSGVAKAKHAAANGALLPPATTTQ